LACASKYTVHVLICINLDLQFKSEDGTPYYYNSKTEESAWETPAGASFVAADNLTTNRACPNLEYCMEHPDVAKIIFLMKERGCAIPSIKCKPNEHPFCEDGRGGAYCCKANQIILCNQRPWVSCKEVAYELTHALNCCRDIKCHSGGMDIDGQGRVYNVSTVLPLLIMMDIDGQDCGYLDAEGVACSEMRASFATACGKLAHNEEEMWDCMHYHAKVLLVDCTINRLY
jgi:hypothetical protein